MHPISRCSKTNRRVSKMKYVLRTVVAMLVAAGLVGVVIAEEGKEGCDGKKGEGHKGGPDKAELLKKFDKDGDGKLNDAEKAEMKKAFEARREAEMLKKFDKDGDGKLSDAEKEEMEKARAARKAKFEAAMLKKFDKDGDGKLSDAEREEAKKAMGEHHKGKKGEGCGGEKKEGV